MDPLYWTLSALAGDVPRFEAAIRHLYAAEFDAFDSEIADRSDDVRFYTRIRLAELIAAT